MKTIKATKTTKKTSSTKRTKPSFTVDLTGVKDARDVYMSFAAAKVDAGIMPTDNELMCIVTAVVEDIERNAIRKCINYIIKENTVKEGFFKRLWRGLKYAFGSKDTGFVVL